MVGTTPDNIGLMKTTKQLEAVTKDKPFHEECLCLLYKEMFQSKHVLWRLGYRYSKVEKNNQGRNHCLSDNIGLCCKYRQCIIILPSSQGQLLHHTPGGTVQGD